MSNAINITLGSNEYAIPELPIGVKRLIWPINNRMAIRAIDGKETGKVVGSTIDPDNMSDAIEAIALALAYIDPAFLPDELENLKRKHIAEIEASVEIEPEELLHAATVVSVQAGGKKMGKLRASFLEQQREKAAPAPTTPAQPSSPIGTTSSQPSASNSAPIGTESNGQ